MDAIKPENRNSSGYTKLRNGAAVASAYHIPFAAHGTRLHLVGAHAAAGFENGLIMESLAKRGQSRKDEAISAIDFHE